MVGRRFTRPKKENRSVDRYYSIFFSEELYNEWAVVQLHEEAMCTRAQRVSIIRHTEQKKRTATKNE